ncbi:MAG: CotH kinase family protein [Aminipila sp.]
MSKKQLTGIALVGIIIFIVLVIGTIHNTRDKKVNNLYNQSLPAAEKEGNPLIGINDDFTVNNQFTSQMPVVIIDTNGIEPPINTEKKKINGEWIFISKKEIKPYVEGTITIIENNGPNKITDKATQISKILIKRRGNTSMNYDKPQYTVKLMTDKGEENRLSLLGMGEDNEWILNGSMADKSMIRNYLSYRLASQYMLYTPDSKYCEVIKRQAGKLQYMGVYLLCESIKQGENRVNISNHKSTDLAGSFILRRDRFDPEGIMLDNYSTRNSLYRSRLEVLYPSKKSISKQEIQQITKEIDCIEEALYSNDLDVYSTYGRLINVDSFIDYFLTNEFLVSYDAGNYSTYMYKDLGGKLSMGPIWDFDGTIDNYIAESAHTEDLAFYKAPWFDRLIKDEAFIEKARSRYGELRRNYLSDDNVAKNIDEIVAYIGPAQEREWNRWAEQYTKNHEAYSLLSEKSKDGQILYRDSREYQQEIYRIKTTLKKHGDAIQQNLDALEKDCTLNTAWSGRQDIFLLLVLVGLIVTVLLLKKR